MIDTKKLTKNCPRCGTPIEPSRAARRFDYVVGGIGAASGGAVGLGLGGPIGAAIGAVLGYISGKNGSMSNADMYNQNQLFEFTCPKCGTNWKEKIHTNDNPEPIDHPLNGIP